MVDIKEKDILKFPGTHWTFPLLFECEAAYGAIFKTMQEYNIQLPDAYLYGCPMTRWMGGRGPAIRDEFNQQTLCKLFSYVRSINAIPTFTFSRTDVTKDDLNDRYSNLLMETGFEYGANFIVCSDILKDYIKEKNPNALVISSVIKPYLEFQGKKRNQEPTFENETAFYNKLLKEYDIVVVRPEYSIDGMQKHPEAIDDISRIEVLINQTCVPNCPKVHEHYTLLQNSGQPGIESEMREFFCPRAKMNRTENLKNHVLHTDKHIKKLVDSGVVHLKVKGRSEFRYSYDSILLILATQMLRSDGAGYYTFRSLTENQKVYSEMDYFKRMLFG